MVTVEEGTQDGSGFCIREYSSTQDSGLKIYLCHYFHVSVFLV